MDAKVRRGTVHQTSEQGLTFIRWDLQARYMLGSRSQEEGKLSPMFEVFIAGFYQPLTLAIRLRLTGRELGSRKQQASEGRGTMAVMRRGAPHGCPAVRMRIAVGSGDRAQPFSGPVDVDFSMMACADLPKEQDWDFRSLLDERGLITVVVELEVLSD